jgi:uncharacterized protein (TIGR02001 family)
MRSETIRTAAWAFVSSIVASLLLSAPSPAQENGDATTGGIILGGRGGPAGDAPAKRASPSNASSVEFSARAGFATDYIYRGTTLSDRGPAVGAGAEATFNNFYAGAGVTSVKLPSQPAAEVAFSTGVRPSFGKFDFDFGWTYFYYPRELPGSSIDYWEAVARADTQITDALRVAGGFAWSPNVSNTGAWSRYVAGGLSFDLGRNTLPYGISAALSGSAGYFWFGNQSEDLGGFPLPAYLNWNAGLTFGRGPFRLDLRYYDTNLSRENCYVFTGDPGAAAGGSVNPVTNPDGLRSPWCSATVVAKFSFALN